MVEASAEELLEDEQDAKIRFIQKAFRSRRARCVVRELVAALFVKEYDNDAGSFVYRNKRTGVKQRTKPLALGDTDLPDPKIYHAPKGYLAVPSAFRQFALVVHCTDFQHEKLPNLPPCATNDYEALRDVLVNPYLAKFRPEDCIFAHNPTTTSLMSNMETLRDLVRDSKDSGSADAKPTLEASSLFVYVCTHVMQVTKGSNRGAYFCFADTNASNVRQLRRTALSLGQFCEAVANIPCRDKMVVLDCAHRNRPKETFFKVMVLYPPSNLYRAVARRCDCHVLGSCELGSGVRAKTAAESDDDDALLPSSPVFRDGAPPNTEKAHEAPEEKEQTCHLLLCTSRDVTSERRGCSNPARAQDEPTKSFSPPRKSILPAMRMEEDSDGKFRVLDELDLIRNWPRFVRERTKEYVASALARRRARATSRRERATEQQRLANYEVALYGATHSCFCGAVVSALGGRAAKLPELRITARMINADVCRDVQRSVEERRAKITLLPALDAPLPPMTTQPVAQTPQTEAGPTSSERHTSVSCVPSVPPPPFPPRAVKVRDRTALLTWDNPVFSGAPPIEYELQSRGTAKYDSREWAPCGSFATITANRFQAPHLVPGLAVRFRVRAKNYGGWGDWSEPSDHVVPIEKPLRGVAADMRRAAINGLPCVLQSMRDKATIRQAQKLGAWQLVAWATKHRGFKRAGLARECARVIMDAMRTFALDAEMQAKGCLLLGWCFHRHDDVARDVQFAASEIVDVACSNFPNDVAVINNAVWARRAWLGD